MSILLDQGVVLDVQNHLLTGIRFCELGRRVLVGVRCDVAASRLARRRDRDRTSFSFTEANRVAPHNGEFGFVEYCGSLLPAKRYEASTNFINDVRNVSEAGDVYDEIGWRFDDFIFSLHFHAAGEHSSRARVRRRCRRRSLVADLPTGRDGMEPHSQNMRWIRELYRSA